MSGAVFYPQSSICGLIIQSHLLLYKHHLASLPSCLPKEFIAFPASLTSDILPSFPRPPQMLPPIWIFPGSSLAEMAPLFLGSPNTLCKPALSSLSHPVWGCGHLCQPPSSCWILVHLCVNHCVWNHALGLRGDQKILVGLNCIANYVSKRGGFDLCLSNGESEM